MGHSRGLGFSFACAFVTTLTGGCSPRHVPPSPAVAPALAEPAPAAPALPAVAIDAVGDVVSGSTVALGRIGGTITAFVADEDEAALRVIDVPTLSEVALVPLTGRPAQVLVSRSGRLLVALRDEAGVAVYAAREDRTLELVKTVATAVEPIALAPVPGGDAFLVVSGFSHTLERFDAVSFARSQSVDVPREPRAVVVSRDGTKGYVSHAAFSGLTTVPLAGTPTVGAIELGTKDMTFAAAWPKAAVAVDDFAFTSSDGQGRTFPGPRRRSQRIAFPARFARQGYALARVSLGNGGSERILAPHAEMITGNPKLISSGYGGGGIEGLAMPTEQFRVSSIDVGTDKRVERAPGATATGHRCRLPRAAAVLDKTLLVICLGQNELVAYTVSDDPKFIRAVPLPAGPTGLAVDPETGKAYAFSLFDGKLTEVDMRALAATAKEADTPPMRTLQLVRATPLAEAADRGRRLFHMSENPRLSKDGRTCASCHPDGRDDGLVWSTPNGPRQTIFLAGRVRHEPPFGWMAKNVSLEAHMRVTMKNLKGTGLEVAEEEALASYLVAMKGPPARAHARTEEEERGRTIFESADAECSSCHQGTDKSDHEAHDVKSSATGDTTQEFLAPSLVGVAGSAPYFHDGRYSSLDELIDKSDGKMGTTGGLSVEDKKALAAYLRTL
jgi:DNA-binding beta-propeller fold protein YncE